MSTTTDKLALFKYDPSTDGAQTFNIKQALNDNWDKLDDAVKQILITLANKENAGAAAAVLENLNTHTGDTNIHVTAVEKAKWDNPGAVLYTPQNLTGEQKVQALQNISAAPGWHGLGAGARMLSAADDLNNVWENGVHWLFIKLCTRVTAIRYSDSTMVVQEDGNPLNGLTRPCIRTVNTALRKDF